MPMSKDHGDQQYLAYEMQTLVKAEDVKHEDRDRLTAGIFDNRTGWDRWAPVLAITLQCIVIALIITLIAVPAWLTYRDSLSVALKSVYVVCTTLIATMISAFTASQMRNIWLYKILRQTEPYAVRRARVLLNIGSWSDEVKAWYITFSLLVFGLLTTAIVGGLAATTVKRRYTLQGNLFDFDASQRYSDCWYFKDTLSPGDIGWKINSSFMVVNGSASQPWCPQNVALVANLITTSFTHAQTLSQLGTIEPPSHCFSFAGGNIHCSALGSPISLSTLCGVRGAFNCSAHPGPFDSSFSQLTACVPVFISNPVKCQQDGRVFGNDTGLTVETTSCSLGSGDNSTNIVLQQDRENVFGLCLNEQPGDATLLVGSTDEGTNNGPTDPYLRSGTMDELALLMGIANPLVGQTPNSYRCDIRIDENAIQYQTVNYTDSYDRGRVPIVTSTGIPCDPATGNQIEKPISLAVTKEMAGTAMAGVMYFLGNGANVTLSAKLRSLRAESNWYGAWDGDLGLPRSNNTLEDNLGILWAVHLSMYYGEGYIGVSNVIKPQFYKVQYLADAERAGPGTWLAILYVIPSLFSIFLLARLLQRTGWKRNSIG